MSYRVLEHTADLGLEAEGKSLAEAFAQAASGLFAIIADDSKVAASKAYEIKIEAASREELLVAWLNRLIYLYDSENVILGHFNITKLDGKRLIAEVSGEPLDAKKHKIETYVKAATYHKTKIEAGKLVKVTVYFDV